MMRKNPIPHPRSHQRGLTLVELLVAMAISLVIAIAAIASLLISRQGFSAVDASSQLRDNARFATDLVQRIGVQTGYKDVPYAATVRPKNNVKFSTNPAPNVYGFNNAKLGTNFPLTEFNPRTSTTEVGYGSDVLILRYQSSAPFPGSLVADKTMIDCYGIAASAIPTDLDDRLASIFFVYKNPAIPNSEPALMCSDGTSKTPQPIVSGVENFQVLYGVDNVTPGAPPSGVTDSVPDRYLRADQLNVPGDAIGTNANWRRVRSLRIGMVLRGPIGSAQDKTDRKLYPFGAAKNSASSTATVGSAMLPLTQTDDPGTEVTAGSDGRLRQVVTFTVHLRNDLGL